jgi:hypothetical protein
MGDSADTLRGAGQPFASVQSAAVDPLSREARPRLLFAFASHLRLGILLNEPQDGIFWEESGHLPEG